MPSGVAIDSRSSNAIGTARSVSSMLILRLRHGC
jgi:hypothetical protein